MTTKSKIQVKKKVEVKENPESKVADTGIKKSESLFPGLRHEIEDTVTRMLEGWKGTPLVYLPDFCDYQEKHPDCEAGRKESYEPRPEPPSFDPDEIQTGAASLCSTTMRTRMLEKGMTKLDVNEVCGCSQELIEQLQIKGMSAEDIVTICKTK
jgi:hypothetical protein